MKTDLQIFLDFTILKDDNVYTATRLLMEFELHDGVAKLTEKSVNTNLIKENPWTIKNKLRHATGRRRGRRQRNARCFLFVGN